MLYCRRRHELDKSTITQSLERRLAHYHTPYTLSLKEATYP